MPITTHMCHSHKLPGSSDLCEKAGADLESAPGLSECLAEMVNKDKHSEALFWGGKKATLDWKKNSSKKLIVFCFAFVMEIWKEFISLPCFFGVLIQQFWVQMLAVPIQTSTYWYLEGWSYSDLLLCHAVSNNTSNKRQREGYPEVCCAIAHTQCWRSAGVAPSGCITGRKLWLKRLLLNSWWCLNNCLVREVVRQGRKEEFLCRSESRHAQHYWSSLLGWEVQHWWGEIAGGFVHRANLLGFPLNTSSWNSKINSLNQLWI